MNQTKSQPKSAPNKENATDSKEWLSVKEVIQMTGYGNSYLRMRLLKGNKLEYKRVTVPGTNIPKLLISRQSLEKYLQEHPRGEKIQLTDEMKNILREHGYDIP